MSLYLFIAIIASFIMIFMSVIAQAIINCIKDNLTKSSWEPTNKQIDALNTDKKNIYLKPRDRTTVFNVPNTHKNL